jgi:Uma2 family endonuclease
VPTHEVLDYPTACLPYAAGESWPAQGDWTYEDYRCLPDDGRYYQVIRGVLYVEPVRTFGHQEALTHLMLPLSDFVDEHELGMILLSPFDVILPEGIATPIHPDLLFIREEDRPHPGAANLHEMPGLVVEILDPLTAEFDERVKLPAYRDAGIPEVWMVDPENGTVAVYGWKEGQFTELERGGEGDEVGSAVLPGFRVQVRELFR